MLLARAAQRFSHSTFKRAATCTIAPYVHELYGRRCGAKSFTIVRRTVNASCSHSQFKRILNGLELQNHDIPSKDIAGS